jgi:hypothetical protein
MSGGSPGRGGKRSSRGRICERGFGHRQADVAPPQPRVAASALRNRELACRDDAGRSGSRPSDGERIVDERDRGLDRGRGHGMQAQCVNELGDLR